MRDRLDVGFEGEDFADPYPRDGRPGPSPGQLALVSVLQFAGNLPDRAAAAAVRTRIDWQYALGLGLDDPGFDHTVLCEFAPAWWPGTRRVGRWTGSWRQGCSRSVAGSARTPRACSRRYGGPAVWSLPGRVCGAALEQLALHTPDLLLPLVEPEGDKRYGRKAEIGKVPGAKAGVDRAGRDHRAGRPEDPLRSVGGQRPPVANFRAGVGPAAGVGAPLLLGRAREAALARRARTATGRLAVRLTV
ncbi:transposase [Streptomyces sp. NRRL B-2790]